MSKLLNSDILKFVISPNFLFGKLSDLRSARIPKYFFFLTHDFKRYGRGPSKQIITLGSYFWKKFGDDS